MCVRDYFKGRKKSSKYGMHTYSHYGFINEAQGISQMPPDPILSGNEILFKMGGKSGSKGLTWMRAKKFILIYVLLSACELRNRASTSNATLGQQDM